MKFNRHSSFYVRASWPSKGLKAVDADPTIFSPNNEQKAVDEIGIGRVMVTSLRYWLVTMGLTSEGKNSAGKIEQKLTYMGEKIKEYDPHFQRIGTIWLLHSNVASNKEEATSWYWFFNEFQKQVFTKEQFIEELKLYIVHQQEKLNISESSLNRDFNCLKQMYLSDEMGENISDYIEEGISSFFSRTGLIAKNEDHFEKINPLSNLLPKEILYYTILKNLDADIAQISIEEIYEGKNFLGKIFNLNYNVLLKKLHEMETQGYIHMFNSFGHNHIQLKEKNKDIILSDYYRKGI